MRPLLLVLLAAALAAPFAPAPAGAQERSHAPSVSGAELARAGAPDLLSALLSTRPAWFAAVGDTAWNEGFERVVVYLNGRHLGELGVLRSLSTDGVVAVRLVSEHHVRQRDPRYPRTGFTHGLWVSTTSGRSQRAANARRSVTLYAVAPVLGMQKRVEEAMAEEGWSSRHVVLTPEILTVEPGARAYSPGVGANAGFRLAGALGVEVAGELHPRSGIGRFYERTTRSAAARYSWGDALLLATYSSWPGRYGIGPVVRAARWEWAQGLCGCNAPESSSSLGYGVAANGSFVLPVRGPAHVEVRVGVRYFFAHETEPYGSVMPALDLSGTEGVVSFGFGVSR